MRVVFLGSPPFATPILARLLASPFGPIAVVTRPERPAGRGRVSAESEVARLAREAEVELLAPRRAREPDFAARLRALAPDVCAVASYGELLTQELLDIPARGTLNVHGSLLPRHRGASPVNAAIAQGDALSGVSIQRVVLALDAGDVLLARETPIGPRETAGELSARLALLGAEALVDALAQVDAGTARYTAQDPARVSVCRKLSKDDGRIDWARDAAALERHVRAVHPWPGARLTLPDGRTLFVHAARVEPGVSGAPPGTLLDADARLLVATGSGALALEVVQLEGKRALASTEFLRGARLPSGARVT